MLIKLIAASILCAVINYAQTFQWAFANSLNYSANPEYLTSTVLVDSSGNPISIFPLVHKVLTSQKTFGDLLIEQRFSNGDISRRDTIFGKVNISRAAIDKDNNLIAAGWFLDTIRINPSHQLINGTPLPQTFLFKRNSSGSILWLKNLTLSLSNIWELESLALDDSGHIWLAIESMAQSTYIRRLNQNGIEIDSFVQANVRSISRIAVNNLGEVWVTGSTLSNPQSFNGFNISPPFDYNRYIVKYSVTGAFQWIVFIKDITFQPTEIVCDNLGNAYISGRLFAPTSFLNLNAHGPQWVYEFFLVKMNSLGNCVWLKQIPMGNNGGDGTVGNSNYLACHNDTSIFVAGFSRNNINWGGGITSGGYGGEDVMLLKYSSAGELRWVKTAGSNLSDRCNSIAVNDFGDCFISGRVSANSMFDSIAIAGGSMNMFTAKLKQPESIIPVELLALNATLNNGNIILRWETATEKNNFGFDVEKRNAFEEEKPFSNWQQLGFVKGKGTATTHQQYSFADAMPPAGKHFYRIKQIDFDGSFEYHYLPEAVEINIPAKSELFQNYPNPFNPSTSIQYQVSSNSHVVLKVFDVLGNEVATLVDEYKPAGKYDVDFNVATLSGSVSVKGGYASGVYFYQLKAGEFLQTRKMNFIK